MSKATWFFSDGSTVTKGATGDLSVLIEAGHKVARRLHLFLVGWRFIFKS
jgi:hypothetical protein